jgi:hypothetical protein
VTAGAPHEAKNGNGGDEKADDDQGKHEVGLGVPRISGRN